MKKAFSEEYKNKMSMSQYSLIKNFLRHVYLSIFLPFSTRVPCRSWDHSHTQYRQSRWILGSWYPMHSFRIPRANHRMEPSWWWTHLIWRCHSWRTLAIQLTAKIWWGYLPLLRSKWSRRAWSYYSSICSLSTTASTSAPYSRRRDSLTKSTFRRARRRNCSSMLVFTQRPSFVDQNRRGWIATQCSCFGRRAHYSILNRWRLWSIHLQHSLPKRNHKIIFRWRYSHCQNKRTAPKNQHIWAQIQRCSRRWLRTHLWGFRIPPSYNHLVYRKLTVFFNKIVIFTIELPLEWSSIRTKHETDWQCIENSECTTRE